MPEHIRALIVILILSIIGFALAKKLAPNEVTSKDISLWRNLWLASMLTSFLAHNFWLFLLIYGCLIILFTYRFKNKPALLFILVIAAPPIGAEIPGFGIVNYLIRLDYIRFIEIVILLPAALTIAKNNSFKFGKNITDKIVLAYIVLNACLALRDTTVTDALRSTFYLFIDIFLPYYVTSRGLKDLTQMKTALYAVVASATIVSIIATFESRKHWLLFNTLGNLLDIADSATSYLGRGSDLRAIATLGGPITLGYFIAIALGFYLYLSNDIKSKSIKRLGFLVLVLGLFAPLSRGPWVGVAVLIVVYLMQSPKAMKNLSMLFFAGVISLPLLTILPNGQKYINLIPFIGKTESENIDYRQKLFTNSMIVISKSPLFGSTNYLDTYEMRQMIQGQGIIDIVNSYLQVTLARGYVGLALFSGAFISVLIQVRKKVKQIRDKTNTLHILGRCIVAVIIAIMVIIATVSSIGVVPTLYWSVLGLGIAYTRIAAAFLQAQSEAIPN